MNQGLFRQEVYDSKRASWLGSISLSQPLSSWVLTIAAAAFAAIVLAFLIFGSFSRRTRVEGRLVSSGGEAVVKSPSDGVVAQLTVREGGRVERGDVLAVVTVSRSTPTGGDTLEALRDSFKRRQEQMVTARSANARRLDAQLVGLRAQLAHSVQELRILDSEMSTRREQVRIAQEGLRRMKELNASKFVSDFQEKQQEQAYLDAIAAEKDLQRQQAGAQKALAQLRQEIAQLPLEKEGGLAEADARLSLLDQEQLQTEGLANYVIKAPISGIVSTQLIKTGQSVDSNQPLLTLLPKDSEVEAELLVPSRAVGFVEAGDQVLVRFEAYPYQKFGSHKARVMRVSRSAMTPTELGGSVPNSLGGEPLYRVVVALDRQYVLAYGKREPLKPGMLVQADVLGESRQLYEWLLEPVYTVAGKLESK